MNTIWNDSDLKTMTSKYIEESLLHTAEHVSMFSQLYGAGKRKYRKR